MHSAVVVAVFSVLRDGELKFKIIKPLILELRMRPRL